jgi:hypothetical protein
MPPKKEHFEKALDEILVHYKNLGWDYKDVNAGELHELVGFYPGRDNRMPTCCSVMRKRMGIRDKIIKQPPKGNGATLTIQYWLV